MKYENKTLFQFQIVQDTFNAIYEFRHKAEIEQLFQALEATRADCKTEHYIEDLCYSVINVSLLISFFL